jgi:RHS repeat-associated protein
MTKKLATAVSLCVLMLTSLRMNAQNGPDNDPDGAPGYVKSVFDHGQVDSINLYNGQLTLPIPLGPAYPIGPKLKLQLVLTYNSRVDDYGKPSAGQQQPDFSYRPLAGNPSLGIGWGLALGAIKACQQGVTYGVCYFGADGSQHMFNKPQTNGSITGDASAFLLQGSGPYDMWDGDGNHYEFDWQVTGYDAAISDFAKGRNGWYLTRLSDAFGNSYSVSYWTGINPLWTYEPNPTCGVASLMKMQQTSNTNSWIPKDITLPSGSKIHVNTGSNGFIAGMILSVDFAELVGGISTTKTWTLQYSAPEIYAKPCGSNTYLYADLQELSAINLPSDLTGSPSYQFTYAQGLLVHVALPTAGSIAYCYTLYYFHHGRAGAMRPGCPPLIPPDTEDILFQAGLICAGSQTDNDPTPNIPPGDCTEDNPIRWVDNQWGVYSRTETVGSATNLTAYVQFSMPHGESGTGAAPTEPQTFTIVTYPPTDKNGSGDPGRQRAKGVLFTSSPRLIGSYPSPARYSVPGDRVGAAIEERVFETPPVLTSMVEPLCTGNPSTDRAFCGSRAVRVTQSTYDYDDAINKEGDRRLQQEKTIHGASTCGSCKYHQVAFTPAGTWESNGRHYYTETHSGTLGGDSRTTTTDWAPANWPSGSPSGAAVLANLYNQRTETQGSSARDQYLEFDTTNGFLRGSFVYDSGRDIAFLNCRYNDGDGNVDKEFTKTFSSSSTPSRTYCSSNYPTFPASVGTDGDIFGKDYTHQNGQLVKAGWINGSGTPPFFFKNVTRDAATGWITGSTDSAGLTTTYQYDSLGRVTLIDPPADLSTFVCYDSATATSAYRAAAKQTCPVAATNPSIATWAHYDYDGLGRLIREKRLQPVGALSKRFTLYDGAGNAKFNSEWVADATSETLSANLATACVFSGGNYGTARPSSAPGTYRMCFDPFGRPQQVVGAKHSSLSTVDRSDGTSLYGDIREAVLTYCLNATFANQQAATCSTGGINATTTTQRDAFGRIATVTEPGGDVTTYAYDVNGKLTSVTQGAQSRTFSYDSAAFLRSETTPERPTVTYASIGSLGNVRTETQPGGLTITRLFDFAGRPTEEDAGGNKYLVNCYDGSGTCVDGSANFSGGTAPKGKLTRRYGYNWIPTIGPIVDDQLTYSGANGRLSQLLTAVGNGDLGSTTTQTWTYDGLGMVLQHGHPRASGSFLVTNTETNGLLTKVNAGGTDVVKAAGYNPAAGLSSWTAGNGGAGIVTTIAQDATLLPRPSSISNSLWGSGTYSYDSAGDVLKMGSDAFQYDSRARLIGATYAGTPRPFAYDRYGNLTQNGATSWTVDSATNRLKSTSFGAPQYDLRGNLASYNGDTMTYDSLDRQYRNSNVNADWVYLFDGAGERMVKFPAAFTVLRREMGRQIAEANVLARGWQLPACVQVFSDVPCTDPDARYINLLYQQNVTAGCSSNPLRYCPNNTISRAEMAVFMVKGYKGASYVPPACAGRFQDVACGGIYSVYAPYIEQLYNDGVTVGCNASPLQFCPGQSIGEWETLVWMAKAPTTPSGGAFWASYHPVPRGSVYTLRDEQNRVVTEMIGPMAPDSSSATLTVARDNAFLGNPMVASYSSGAWTYSASDHLGSPRVLWNSSGQLVETHKYWPYGEDTNATPPNQRLAFTLMERDTENSHFYDHARHHDFGLGRFLSPDSVGGHPVNPQSWNRYAYTLGNPLKNLDPDGRYVIGFTGIGNAPSGVGLIVRRVDGAPGVGPARLFRWQDLEQAVDFARREFARDPKQPAIVVGHSMGVDASLAFAEELGRQGIRVSLLIAIDPTQENKPVPQNVDRAVGYYQRGSWPGGYKLYSLFPDTKISNIYLANTVHTDIDNEVANSRAVENQIREVGKAYSSRVARCGDADFIGPCQ